MHANEFPEAVTQSSQNQLSQKKLILLSLISLCKQIPMAVKNGSQNQVLAIQVENYLSFNNFGCCIKLKIKVKNQNQALAKFMFSMIFTGQIKYFLKHHILVVVVNYHNPVLGCYNLALPIIYNSNTTYVPFPKHKEGRQAHINLQ